MKLIIAANQSVGKVIAAALGVNNFTRGYISGDEYIVSWCRGHLMVKLCNPEDYDSGLHEWTMDTLPIIPEQWKTNVYQPTASQFHTLRRLMNNASVAQIICATDADREGELNFRLVYDAAKCIKPVKRLWISSNEDSAIIDGMNHLRDMQEYDNLYHAALCRARADWLIGINVSRLYSLKYGSTLNVGRVQSPTVNLIVQRDYDIKHFTPQFYHIIIADLGDFQLNVRTDNDADARDIMLRCMGKQAHIVDVKSCQKHDNPPHLYNLTDIQRDANRMYGYTAKQTLDGIQMLYEYKLCTYPRTANRFLTPDMRTSTSALIQQLLDTPSLFPDGFHHTLPVQVDSLICDTKVSLDHHAIMPTQAVTADTYANLPGMEQNLLRLIIYRLIVASSVPRFYRSHTIKADISGIEFSSILDEETIAGWKGIQNQLFPDSEESPADTNLLLPEKESYYQVYLFDERKQTEPPQPYTEDTLLAAMEHAGQTISDTALRSAISDCGLGTSATRASIIENIIQTGYVERREKSLYPTKKAIQFMSLLDEKVKSPELTAHWELMLSEIQNGQADPDVFMSSVSDFLYQIKTAVLQSPDHPKLSFDSKLCSCPRCTGKIIVRPYSYACDSCNFKIHRIIAGKKITPAQAKRLIQDGKTCVIQGFTNKSGKSFSCRLKLNAGNGVSFDFPGQSQNSTH